MKKIKPETVLNHHPHPEILAAVAERLLGAGFEIPDGIHQGVLSARLLSKDFDERPLAAVTVGVFLDGWTIHTEQPRKSGTGRKFFGDWSELPINVLPAKIIEVVDNILAVATTKDTP